MLHRRALVIDQDFSFSSLVQEWLSDYAFEVHVTEDGGDGLAQVADLKPNVIFIAVDLPDRSGFSLFTKAKNLARRVPVILSTSTLPWSEMTLHEKLKIHADIYLDKRTLTQEEFLEKLDERIGLQAAPSESKTTESAEEEMEEDEEPKAPPPPKAPKKKRVTARQAARQEEEERISKAAESVADWLDSESTAPKEEEEEEEVFAKVSPQRLAELEDEIASLRKSLKDARRAASSSPFAEDFLSAQETASENTKELNNLNRKFKERNRQLVEAKEKIDDLTARVKKVSVSEEERVLAEVEVIRQRTERSIEQTEESLKAEKEAHEATRKKLAAKDEEWQEKSDDLGKEHSLETVEMRKVHQAILAQKDEEMEEAVRRGVEEQESEFATRMETRLADELDENQKNREEEVAKLQDRHTVEIDELKEKYETFIGKLTSEVDQYRDVAASREQDQETLLQRREVLESRVEELESALKHAQLQAEQALSLALLELENKLNAEKAAALADAEAEWRGKLDSETAHLHASLSDAGEQKKLEGASALSQLASQLRQEKRNALEEAESKWKNKLAEVESQWKEILEEVQQERETAVASLRDEYAQNLTHLQQNQQETTTTKTQEAEETQKQLEEEVAGLRTVTEQLEQDLLRTQSQLGESQQKVAEKDKTISSLKATRDNLTRAVEAYQQNLEEREKSGVKGIVKGIFSK